MVNGRSIQLYLESEPVALSAWHQVELCGHKEGRRESKSNTSMQPHACVQPNNGCTLHWLVQHITMESPMADA